jgi:hypothetical protein
MQTAFDWRRRGCRTARPTERFVIGVGLAPADATKDISRRERFPPPWTVEDHNDTCFIVRRFRKAKTPARPRWGLVRTSYRTGARGGGGLGSARHLFTLSPVAFGILYQIAHSKRRWKSGITPHVGGTKQPENGRHRVSAEVTCRFATCRLASKVSGHETF